MDGKRDRKSFNIFSLASPWHDDRENSDNGDMIPLLYLFLRVQEGSMMERLPQAQCHHQ